MTSCCSAMCACVQVESLSRKLNAAQRRLDAEEDEVKRLTGEAAGWLAGYGSCA